MRLPRTLAAGDLIKWLCKQWGYVKKSQSGSHIKLETFVPSRNCITIPEHDPLQPGTLKSILRATARHKGVTEDDILRSLSGG